MRRQEATLEILDASGNVLRTLEPRTEAGLNHMTWDLRTEGYVTFPGMIFWGARSQGPAAAPGTVHRPPHRRRTDGNGPPHGGEESLDHRRHRRGPAGPVRVLQHGPGQGDGGQRGRHRHSPGQSPARRPLREVRRRRLREAGDRLVANASAVEENIYQVRNQSGQDPLNFPIKVNNRLANLMSMAERGDGRPGNMMPEIFNILS